MGLACPPMGWSWAVFIAQCILQDDIFGIKDPMTQKPMFPPSRVLVEGVPVPQMSWIEPCLHYGYIDNFAILVLMRNTAHDHVHHFSTTVEEHLERLGFTVHKEE